MLDLEQDLRRLLTDAVEEGLLDRSVEQLMLDLFMCSTGSYEQRADEVARAAAAYLRGESSAADLGRLHRELEHEARVVTSAGGRDLQKLVAERIVEQCDGGTSLPGGVPGALARVYSGATAAAILRRSSTFRRAMALARGWLERFSPVHFYESRAGLISAVSSHVYEEEGLLFANTPVVLNPDEFTEYPRNRTEPLAKQLLAGANSDGPDLYYVWNQATLFRQIIATVSGRGLSRRQALTVFYDVFAPYITSRLHVAVADISDLREDPYSLSFCSSRTVIRAVRSKGRIQRGERISLGFWRGVAQGISKMASSIDLVSPSARFAGSEYDELQARYFGPVSSSLRLDGIHPVDVVEFIRMLELCAREADLQPAR